MSSDFEYNFDRSGGKSNNRFILHFEKNTAPTIISQVKDMKTNEDELYNYTFKGVFSDADSFDKLSYSVSLIGGGNLPAWLHFDPVKLSFSGTPGNDDSGEIQIALKATDNFGEEVICEFELEVVNVNDIPFVLNSISDQYGNTGTHWAFTFSDDVFSDIDLYDKLSYSAELENGAQLPDWLMFNPESRTFNGISLKFETLAIKVVAKDISNAEIFDMFDLDIHTMIGNNELGENEIMQTKIIGQLKKVEQELAFISSEKSE